MTTHSQSHIAPHNRGFTLIEVVLAIGIFLLSILALVGLLGPTLSSVEDVTQADEVTSVVNTVNAFLMNSPDIAPGGSKFNAIFNQLQSRGALTIVVFREFVQDDDLVVAGRQQEVLRVGFGTAGFPTNARVVHGDNPATNANQTVNLSRASSPIYFAILTASPVTPSGYIGEFTENDYGGFVLNANLNVTPSNPASDNDYLEGYLAMEVRVFAETTPSPSQVDNTFAQNFFSRSRAHFQNRQPIFTYNMAIVR